MAIGAEFVAKLLPALDELEARWRAGKISPDKAIDFCLRCRQRLGLRPEFEALRQRVKVTLDAAWAARESSPQYLRRDVDELERRWARSDNDNYRDDFEECSVLIVRTTPGSPERTRVLAVLASLLDEATSAAAINASVRDYLSALLDRAQWQRIAAEPLPPARPRESFVKTRRSSKPAPGNPRNARAGRSALPRVKTDRSDDRPRSCSMKRRHEFVDANYLP
jgi:hypothetical protein